MARTKPKPAPEWPASTVELRPIASVSPRARNPRQHSPEQVAQLAAAIQEWGWTVPLLVDESGELIAGHGRLLAAQQLGLLQVPCMVARGWTDAQKRAYVLADNQLAANSSWDADLLRGELEGVFVDGFDLGLLGFDEATLASATAPIEAPAEPIDLEGADDFEGTDGAAVSMLGDVWILGDHRVRCGDSTKEDDVHSLLAGELANLVHADPPYGMGKEADGVVGDNVYRDELDAFQTSWLTVALQVARENCSVYVWGNAPDLWRWWWRHIDGSVDLTLRTELVWAKDSAIGVNSPDMHTFPPITERCLFAMRGRQFLGNQNKDDYWDGYEPFRLWMVEQRDAVGWNAAAIKRITGTAMAGHWFGKSQFAVITAEQYEKLRKAAAGKAFALTYDELCRKFGGVHSGGKDYRNTHEPMTDVWQFPRVVGVERFGHATPKPVAMLVRAIRSSCPDGGLVYEPFLGSGSTLIAAEASGRRCFGMELQPKFVDVTIRRWQQRTGKSATLEAGGATFDQTAAARAAE